VTTRSWNYVAGACIVVALAFLLAVARPLLGLRWHKILPPLGLILLLTIAVPLLLSGLAAILSHRRQTTPTSNRPDPNPRFTGLKRASRLAGVAVAIFYLAEFVWITRAGVPPVASKPEFSRVSGEPSRTVSVLFIGNSFTYVENMPGMLVQIASSDPTNRIRLEVYAVTKGGASLAYMFQSAAARDALKLQHWDYLVLQEQSEWTGSQPRIAQTYAAVTEWTQAAKQIGAMPVFYETWADKAGGDFYTDKDSYFFGQNPDQVQENIEVQSKALAQHFGMPLIPVGNYWAYAEKQANAPDLYATDRHHPSIAGAYLTALMFYRVFTGNKPANVIHWPRELTAEQAQFLIGIASK